jgi:endonuclease/exonuclease/phosphatase family metal-dependent hydrolase
MTKNRNARRGKSVTPKKAMSFADGSYILKTMLSIASLNIHQFLHREETLRALKTTDADVFCLQEVPISAVTVLEQELGATAVFVPMGNFPEVSEEVGIALFVRGGDLLQFNTYRYHETNTTPPLSFADCDRILQYATIEKDGVVYTIGHTHFVWTPLGEPNEQQWTAMERLLKYADTIPDMVLCGDFNAPRGKAVWGMLAKSFTDNIPLDETTTLDLVLHRAAPLYYVVDGMFTKGRCKAHDVAVIFGASDHTLITALLSIS